MIGLAEHVDEAAQLILEAAALRMTLVSGFVSRNTESAMESTRSRKVRQKPETADGYGTFSEAQIERICWLVGHHHTYDSITGIDYQILVEADFLVNIYEDNLPVDAICKVREKIFKTSAGRAFARYDVWS